MDITNNKIELPMLFTVEQVAQILGIGRSTVFQLIKNEQIESIRLGRSRRIPVDAMQNYVDDLRAERVNR
jgi:excisionase family DNA binding protein